MEQDKTTVVIGAGPYGLSTAAHLQAKGLPTLVFGKTMGFWEGMPEQLFLKSVLSASSLSDPAGKYNLTNFFKATATPREEPIPILTFLKYGHWFQQQAVKNVDPTFVQHVSYDGKRFHLDMADGREVEAGRVVVAAGIEHFTYIPDFAKDLPPHLATHAQAQKDFSVFKDRRVAVIGSGQSALESTALLHEAGADVELIARGPVIWIDRKLYDRVGPARHIFYPPSDVGPPGINWLVAFPQVFKQLPEEIRYKMEKRAIRPAGAQWLRTRVDKQVRTTEHTQVTSAVPHGDTLQLTLSDGTAREVDFMLLSTGYRANLTKLPFLDPSLLQQIQVRNNFPILNSGFESSVPQLHFIGALANHTFGPICRFVAGSKASAQQIARYASRVA